MKYLFLLLLIPCLCFGGDYTGIYTEKRTGKDGLYVRIINRLSHSIICYIESDRGYHVIMIKGSRTSRWYRVTNEYIWDCE